MKQLLLPNLNIGIIDIYKEEYFMISESNIEAYNHIKQWPAWNNNIILLYGPKSSGKTHLCHIWKHISNAFIITENNSSIESIVESANYAFIIDDIDKFDNDKLLQYYNIIHQENKFLLLTSTTNISEMKFKTPDLQSRIESIPTLNLQHPDENILRTALSKEIYKRQIRITSAHLEYMLQKAHQNNKPYKLLIETINELEDESWTYQRKLSIKSLEKIMHQCCIK